MKMSSDENVKTTLSLLSFEVLFWNFLIPGAVRFLACPLTRNKRDIYDN